MGRPGKTMTAALREAIASSGLTYGQIERDTGVQKGSIVRFMLKQQSLRLDKADILAAYFKIEVKRKGR